MHRWWDLQFKGVLTFKRQFEKLEEAAAETFFYTFFMLKISGLGFESFLYVIVYQHNFYDVRKLDCNPYEEL